MELSGELLALVADVLEVAPAEVVGARAGQVLRRSSGRTITTWTVEHDGRRRQVVTVVGDGGPRRGLPLRPLEDGTPAVAFRPRDDPRLPGLRIALAPERLSAVLGRPVLRTRRRRYRPLGRAVVEAATRAGPVWCKVLRPVDVADLAALHRAAMRAVPGPAVEHVDTDLGLLVLGHLDGTSLRALLRGADGPLPDVEEVLAVAAGFAGITTVAPSGRSSPLAAVERNAARLAHLVPEAAGRLDDLTARLLAARSDVAPGEVTIHGDLHAAQLLVQDGRVTGVLDLDDTGLGESADDLARLVGHTVCTVDGTPSPRALEWRAGLERAVLARVDERLLAPRVAAVVLGLASGPHRVQTPDWRLRTLARLALAERWVDNVA